MDEVYRDQIWLQSNCREIENNTLERFRLAFTGKPVLVHLVDTIDKQWLHENFIVVTDNFFPNQKYPLWPEYYGSFCYRPRYLDQLPTSLFACFINRACPFRQSWLYQFVRRRIFDQGLITYRLDYRDNDWPIPRTDLDRRLLFDEMFRRGNHEFSCEHQILKQRVPLQNFDVEIEQAIMDSKISLVIETYFDNTGIISFSEKIFRNLLLPRPWMLFAAPHAVAHLRNVGFDVMDYLVDHGYDNMTDSVARQIEILTQLETWQNVTFDTNTVDRMKQSCYNNYLLLRDFRKALPSKTQRIINNLQNLFNDIH